MSQAYAADFKSLRQVIGGAPERGSRAGELKGRGEKEK
jgi:hypothetical protein